MAMASAITPEERLEIRKKTAKPLLWLGIVSIVMLFAGLTSAYVVSKGTADEAVWFNFQMPGFFWISSGVILLSSLTMNMALTAVKKNDQERMRIMLMLTGILGFAFCVTQYLGWGQLVDQKIFLVEKINNAGKYLYFISGLHLLHLFGGLISLSVTITNASRSRYSPENYLGLQLCAIYWHFLDILWIYLCLFFWFIH
jgi:cytochrome c oxidase subunit 3